MRQLIWITACVAMTLSCPLLAQSDEADDGSKQSRLLPLWDDWFVEQGIDLPMPFGLGLAGIYMDRDIEVTDVRVQFGDRPPQSISDTVDFDVRNRTGMIAARADAWILPFLNVYVMGGRTQTDTRLNTRVEIPVPGPGDPIRRDISVDQEVAGPFLGIGTTLVVGHRDWFGMFDANYGEADLDAYDGQLDIWMFSGRFGRLFESDLNRYMLWAGALYLDSERTITLSEELPLIGLTEVEVDQRPVDPLTWQLGMGVFVGQNWHIVTEVGSNFDDALIIVASGTYRF